MKYRDKTARKRRIEKAIFENPDASADKIAEKAGESTRGAMLKFCPKPFSAYRKSIVAKLKVENPKRLWVSLSDNPYRTSWNIRKGYVDAVVSSEDRKISVVEYPKVIKGTNFSSEIEVVENRYIQPIKRVRIAANTFLNAGRWFNGEKLLKVSVAFAESDNDLYITEEDGMIISKALADKTGLMIGDKLLSLNGLKCVICDIREQDKDITINQKQIFGEKPTRHTYGAVKEYNENDGSIFIYFSMGTLSMLSKSDRKGLTELYNPREVREIAEGLEYGDRFTPKDRTFSFNHARASPTVIPFLFDIFGDDLGKIVGNQASILSDVLKMINADFKLTPQGLVLIPKLKSLPLSKEVKSWGGCVWNVAKPQPYSEKDLTYSKDEKLSFYRVLQSTLFIPEWVKEQNTWIDKSGKETQNPFYRAIVEKYGFEGRGFYYFLNRAVLSEFDNSLVGLTAVAINVPDKRVIWMNVEDRKHIELNKYNEAVIYREPIVSRENLQVVKVEINPKIPTGKIGVSVEVQKAMYGDFDSDTDMLLGTKGIDKLSDKLYYELEPITLHPPGKLPDVIENRTEREFLHLAFHEHMKRRKDGWDITNTGWLSKLALCNVVNQTEEDSVKRNLKLLERMKDKPKEIEASLERINDIAKRPYSLDSEGNRVYVGAVSFSLFMSSSVGNIYTGRKIDKLYSKPSYKGYRILATPQSPYTRWIMLLCKIGGKKV